MAISGTVAAVVEEGGACVDAFCTLAGEDWRSGIAMGFVAATAAGEEVSRLDSISSHTTEPHIKTMAVANKMAGRRWRMSGEKLAYHRTGASSAFEMAMNFFNINLVAPLRFA